MPAGNSIFRWLSIVWDGCGGEYLAEQARQFRPISVFAAAAYSVGQRFKAAQRGDFGFSSSMMRFSPSPDRGYPLLGDFHLVIRRLLQVFHVLGIEYGSCKRGVPEPRIYHELRRLASDLDRANLGSRPQQIER
jgi:hypothetical protein